MASKLNMAGFSKEHVVEIQEIDEQHETFFDMLGKIDTVADDLYRPLDDDGVDDVLDIMSEIREFAQAHFGTEEGYMEEVDYPDLDTHKAAHDKLLDDIVRMEGELLNGSSVPPIKIRTFLADSSLEHIISQDMAFGKFYKKNKN